MLPEGLSRDPKVVESFVHDPLVWHGRAPARTVIEMYRAGRVALGRAGELTVPLLVVHGEADPIVPPIFDRETSLRPWPHRTKSWSSYLASATSPIRSWAGRTSSPGGRMGSPALNRCGPAKL